MKFAMGLVSLDASVVMAFDGMMMTSGVVMCFLAVVWLLLLRHCCL